MEIIKIIIYGLLEGITEWLPVSSTGHLILLKELIPLNVSYKFWSLFEVIIQLGAVLAVVVIYSNKLKFKTNLDTWNKIIISCIPAVIVGLFFNDFFEKYFYNKLSISFALIIVGILFIIVEKQNKVNIITEISYKTAFLIGISQVIAGIFPGVSRSGITILCGLLLGIQREKVTEFTFLMSVPVMFGASFLKIIKYGLFNINDIFILLIGSLTAFITSLFVIKFLMNYIKKHNFIIFGGYRIILGIIVLFSLI